MSRLGHWQPSTPDERLDRLESLAEIRQLAVRYAAAVDSRDLDSLAALFAPDVQVGKDSYGREALKDWFGQILTRMRVSIHFVGNHIIDFDDADHAHGLVYCRDELERPATGEWQIGALQYADSYLRTDGEWCFGRRRFRRWYIADALDRPGYALGVNAGHDPLPAGVLPDEFPTWKSFWGHETLGIKTQRSDDDH